MPTITFRIDELMKAALDGVARERGMTASDLIRELIREEVNPRMNFERNVPVTPTTLSLSERLQLSLNYQILSRLDEVVNNGEDKKYFDEMAKLIQCGFTASYEQLIVGMSNEMPLKDCNFVIDVLDMFTIIEVSKRYHESNGKDCSSFNSMIFDGFDVQNLRETSMASYVRFLFNQDRWELVAKSGGKENWNSHSPRYEIYSRMLNQYNQIKEFREIEDRRYNKIILSEDELRMIKEARVHPDNR